MEYDFSREKYLTDKNNYGLNLGTYLYNILEKNNNKISYNQNISGIRYDKVLFSLIPGTKSVPDFINKFKKLPDDKLDTVYQKVFDNFKHYGYQNNEYCIANDIGFSKYHGVHTPTNTEDKIYHLTEFLTTIYGDKKKYKNICEFSFNNIFKRMIFETTTSYKSYIPYPDYSDKSKSESNDLSNIMGKNKDYILSGCLTRANTLISSNTEAIHKIRENLQIHKTMTDNTTYLFNLKNLEYINRYKACKDKDHDIDNEAINELISFVNLIEEIHPIFEGSPSGGVFSDDIKSIFNIIEIQLEPPNKKKILKSEKYEMESNRKLMMRTLNITYEDYLDASKQVKSSIDLYELERFEHYKIHNKDPDNDPNFKPKHGSPPKK